VKARAGPFLKEAMMKSGIRRAELADRQTSMTTANDLAVRRALEAAGVEWVEFIDKNGGGRTNPIHIQQRSKAPVELEKPSMALVTHMLSGAGPPTFRPSTPPPTTTVNISCSECFVNVIRDQEAA
jgi:hypothetical protein